MSDLIEVVAAAIVRDGAVLAARRVRPPGLAGGWEFPGGKIEPGEDGPAALARECLEELGVVVEVGELLGVGQDAVVRVTLYAATLAAGDPVGAEPVAGDDHDALRWLFAAELETVAWLPVDAELVPAVRSLLR